MFIPCDHCLRKHGSHTVLSRVDGLVERLHLCDECYRKHREASRPLPTPSDLTSKELEIAQGLQASLLPRQTPRVPGFDLSAYFRPSPAVGGDYYDFIEMDSDHLGLVVADVSGTGVPGSIVMTETRALVKSEAVRAGSAAETLRRVNRILYQDIKRGTFVTLFFAVLQPRTSTLTAVSAGHNPMILWRKASNTCHLINPNGLALGIDRGPLFEKTLKEQTLQLFKGDRVALYTDGATEAKNRQNEEFGQSRFYERVKQLADRSSADFLSMLARDLDAHQGDAPARDDIAILTARVV
jgi:sigma-B regulation protein RsbU (phosphoserine phosphatase)